MRLIPIIADEYPDPEKGSGAVKITAAHDFNDFSEVWSRHRDKDYFKKQINGGLINLFTPGRQDERQCPAVSINGLDRYEARKRIIADLEALGLLEQDRERHQCRAARRPLQCRHRAHFI